MPIRIAARRALRVNLGWGLALGATRLGGACVLAAGLVLGLFWAALNWALDLAVLVGAMGSPLGEWVIGIGLRYLMIPIMAGAMGAVGAAQRS